MIYSVHCENSKCKHNFEHSCMREPREMLHINLNGKCEDFEPGVYYVYKHEENSKGDDE